MNEFSAEEIGNRCRRIRMASNISQQELADRCQTSPQNISKFEKYGISDIQWINTISNALGQSLLVSEADTEGEIGEVGKEIMRRLIEAMGYFKVKRIMSHKLYGLSDEKVTHEIVKLQRIGMIVREQYTDFEDTLADILFITAKGLITIKNMDTFSDDYDKYKSVSTYEMIIDEYGNYQDYVDGNKAEKLIRLINYRKEDKNQYSLSSPYRANYISYLKANFENGIYDDYSDNSNVKPLLTNRNCYYDILFRMAFDLNNEKMWKYVFETDEKLADSAESILQSDESFDEIESDAEKDFEEDMPWILDDEDYMSFSREIEETQKESEEAWNETNDKMLEEDFLYRFYPEEIYKKNRPLGKGIYPSEWFSKEQIEAFIHENFGPAVTEEEKNIEKVIRIINREKPETLEYYRFPKTWEDNGLAELVRDTYKISNSSTRRIKTKSLFEEQLVKYGLNVPNNWKNDIRPQLMLFFEPIVSDTDCYFVINKGEKKNKLLELKKEGEKQRLIHFKSLQSMDMKVAFRKDIFIFVSGRVDFFDGKEVNGTQPDFKISLKQLWNVLCVAVGKDNLME